MKSTTNAVDIENKKDTSIKFIDGFTKAILAVMLILLIAIFGAGKYMDSHHMEAGGTDDKVNTMSSKNHHPFVELPGDAEVGAFSVANFCAGLIVGHHWEKMFGKSKSNKKSLEEE
jgi:cobalt/nickel transport protein